MQKQVLDLLYLESLIGIALLILFNFNNFLKIILSPPKNYYHLYAIHFISSSYLF